MDVEIGSGQGTGSRAPMGTCRMRKALRRGHEKLSLTSEWVRVKVDLLLVNYHPEWEGFSVA
jgi:hypothetical protein